MGQAWLTLKIPQPQWGRDIFGAGDRTRLPRLASYGVAAVQPAASDTPPWCHIEVGSSSCLQKQIKSEPNGSDFIYLVPVSCCGARCAPCRQCGCVAHRPRPLARVASSASGSAPLAPRTLTCGSSPTDTKINPIVNVSFTMGFIGAGDRTRTGTLSPAVDFESTTSTIPSHRQVLK